jgi:acyl-CoA thioesterase-1
MSRFVTVIAAALLLAGCKGDAPAPAATESVAATDEMPVMGPERRILAVGDSLFAGYGLAPGESYPDRLEVALRAQGINAQVTNAGVSGDTSAAGAQRFAFVLDAQPAKPDLVLVEFGGNDVLRGLPPAETRKNIEAMLAETQKRGLKVVLVGMLAPPNLGADYKAQFEPIYPALAKKYGAQLVPFFLDGVIDKPEWMQADHLHPTAQGVEQIVKRTSATVAGALPPK